MKIEFETDTSAFRDSNGDVSYDHKALEVARILREITNEVRYGYDAGLVKDNNGNVIGQWSL